MKIVSSEICIKALQRKLLSVLTENPKQDSLSAVQFRNDLTRDFNVKLLDTKIFQWLVQLTLIDAPIRTSLVQFG